MNDSPTRPPRHSKQFWSPVYIDSASVRNSSSPRPFHVLTESRGHPDQRGRSCQSSAPEIENCNFDPDAFLRWNEHHLRHRRRAGLDPGYRNSCISADTVANSNLSSSARSTDGEPSSHQLWDNGASSERFLEFLYNPFSALRTDARR